MRVAEKIRELQGVLLSGLVERDTIVRLTLLAAFAGEHILLLGPPGTAKSLVARRLRYAFAEATYFERLLTRFTVPEELFGPLSIKGLEEDRYERLTSSYLPTASVAFLDEIFKANSAILNALLTLLNEREFDNGANREETPLISVVGASNELPENEELDALYDRFLLRAHLGPVSKDNFPSLLALHGNDVPEVPEHLQLKTENLRDVQQAAEKVNVPGNVLALLNDLREWCAAEEIPVSDRRWRKVVNLLQVAAYTNGRDEVSIWDCWLLQHCIWNTPEDREKVYEWYAGRVGASAKMDTSKITFMVEIHEARLKEDQTATIRKSDSKGEPLFKGLNGRPTVKKYGKVQKKNNEGEPLYVLPKDVEFFVEGTRIDPSDRTNSGNGFTLAELQSMSLDGSDFLKRTKGKEYLEDEEYWFGESVELEPLYKPKPFKVSHINAVLSAVGELEGDMKDYISQLIEHVNSLEDDIRSNLWIPEDFTGPASVSLNQTKDEAEALMVRVRKMREGFENLPREEEK